MSDQKESSVLFNLKELMNLEEDRIQTEAEAAEVLALIDKLEQDDDVQRVFHTLA